MRKSINRLTILAIAAVSLSTSAFAAPEQVAQPSAVVAPRDAASGIISPRDPASGQATGIQSPRDPASGLATSRATAPGGNAPQAKVTFEDILVSSAVAPKPGAGSKAAHHTCVMNKNCQEFESAVAPRPGGGQASRTRPPANRPARIRRRGGA